VLYCDNGTNVKAGQLCAKIDPAPYQAAVDRERAALDEAVAQLEKDKADLTDTKAAFERSQIRVRRRAISSGRLKALHNAYKEAQAQTSLTEEAVAQRQAALHSAEINLGYTDMLAPLDGTVVSRNVDLGQTVAAGSEGVPLFLIGTDLTIMQVNANVRENDIGKVKLGDKASFMVESISNHTFDGEVVQIRRSTRENATTSDVVISAPNRESLLQSGMKATVQILVDKHTVL
jgi:HlyD family secretion protein